MDIDALYYDSVDLLKKMIACPSHSREEKNLADILEDHMKHMSLKPDRKGNNLWLIPENYDQDKLSILLNSHIDTVKPVAGWSLDPYLPQVTEDKLYGLGSNDAGASLVSLLYTYIYIQRKEQSYNLIFLASCEEEVSGKNGIESVLPDLPQVSFGIVGEPTGMHPAIAEKGLMVLDCLVKGRSGHAARDEGENAIYKSMKCIDWFRNYEFPLKSDLLGNVKMSVTMIEAGTQHNVVPDKCTFTVDVRTNECYRNEVLFSLIQEQCGCEEVKARSFRLNSSGIDREHPVVQRAVMLGKEPFGSPTLSDQALMSFPSLKIGPGDSSRSHTADEFIFLPEIREAIEIYIRLLDGLSLA